MVNSRSHYSPGLLIVDLQAGFQPSSRLLQRIQCRIPHYQQIAATQFCQTPESLFRKVLNWQKEPGEIALPLPANTIYIRKTGYGLPTNDVSTLIATGISAWDIVGLESDACVLACAFSLWDAGIYPTLIAECIDGPNIDGIMNIARRQFGQALNAQTR